MNHPCKYIGVYNVCITDLPRYFYLRQYHITNSIEYGYVELINCLDINY